RRGTVYESDEILYLGLRRRVSGQGDLAVGPDRNAVALDHLAVVVDEVDDGAPAMLVGGGGLHQPLLDLLAPGFVADGFRALAALENPGEHLAEQLGRGASFERNVPRRIMVTGEQSPQLAVTQN